MQVPGKGLQESGSEWTPSSCVFHMERFFWAMVRPLGKASRPEGVRQGCHVLRGRRCHTSVLELPVGWSLCLGNGPPTCAFPEPPSSPAICLLGLAGLHSGEDSALPLFQPHIGIGPPLRACG